MGVASKQGVGNAQQQGSESLPPVGAELGSEVADRVVKELASVLEEQTALLVRPDLHAFVGCLKIQGQSYPMSVCVFRQESAGHIGAGGKADVFRHEAKRVNIACCAIQNEPGIFTVCEHDVELAHGCARWPLALGVRQGPGKLFDPAVGYLFLDELIHESRVLLSARPVARAMQEMQVVQVVVLQAGLSLRPLHAGRDRLENACRHAALKKCRQGRVRVGDAGCKSLQELKTKGLALLHVRAGGFGARRMQRCMSNLGESQLMLVC